MTRRLTISIVAGIIVTLVLTGVGTLFLTAAQDRRELETELRDQSQALATLFEALPVFDPDSDNLRARLERVQNQLELDGAALLVFRDGVLRDALPDGVEPADLEAIGETDDRSTSGRHGNLVYAATAIPRPGGTSFIVVLTRQAGGIVEPAFRWFLLASGISILIGVGVAVVLGRRLTRPILAAHATTRRIAAGELSARVDTGDGDDELAELGTAINHMADALARAQGLEQQFLLSVSHDLRTPLTSIRGYAEAIADGTATDPARAAGVIGTEAQRLERLVGDLLDLARLDARQFSFEPRPFDVAELVAEVAAGFERRAGEAGIGLEVAGPDQPVPVTADPDRLAQVIANLLENGLKYAALQLHVAYGVADGHPQIVVSDDGPGIADDDLPHVFERLYVARRRPQRKESGSGLGLAIVRELTEAMGGRVTAGPRRGGGTRFVVELPPSSASLSE